MERPSARTLKAKVCMVGEGAVGKTSLVRRFVHGDFDDRYIATLGATVVGKDFPVREDGGDALVKLLVWDIGGEAGLLRPVEEAYFNNAAGIVAVCDLTRLPTFEHLPEWIGRVERIAGKLPIAIALNKVDLREEASVPYDESAVRGFADEVGGRVYATSAKTGEGVEPLFAALAADVLASARRRQAESHGS